MNVLFINHNGFLTNSAIHVANFANALAGMGVDAIVAVPDGDDARPSPPVSFATTTYDGAARSLRFADGNGPDLIHAWTPRRRVTEITRRLAAAHACPYIVHLEDNEHVVAAAFLGLATEEFVSRSFTDPGLRVPPFLSHPADMQDFLAGAAGVTALIDRLLEFKPAHAPGIEIWPAAEDALFHPREPDRALRAKLRIADQAKVIVYHGNTHPANVAEVRSLYLAVAAIRRRGIDVVLVRLGTDHVDVVPADLPELAQGVIKVPFQPREEIPRYLSLADAFVQPGRVDAFNSYRFPSKLPEFFAMGRPVALPAANIGLKVKDGEDALVLRRGDAVEIADALLRIFSDAALSVRLGEGGRRFYERTLGWERSAHMLKKFYDSVLGDARLDSLANDSALKGIGRRYAGFRPDGALSYATVGDFADSLDHLNGLATLNQDLKDAQRPWVLKAILGAVPAGGRLLEIGAGDPWVAELLTRLGYDVTVIDPYDGRDRGPDQFERIRAQYPRIKFVRGEFPQALADAPLAGFDCIYSISVLEHVPGEAIAPLFDAIAAHSRSSSSPTIHSIDHVLLGNGAEHHRVNLGRLVGRLGFSEEAVADVLARADADPETYFLSAEAHNRWRGNRPYAEFPMRRCISVQICCPAGGVSAPPAGDS